MENHIRIGRHQGWINMDVFTGDSRSLFGGFDLWFGEKIYTSFHLMGGKTWGDINPGHNTFRIGGNLTEGYFTQRPTRLFPLRGFEDNVLEAKDIRKKINEFITKVCENEKVSTSGITFSI